MAIHTAAYAIDPTAHAQALRAAAVAAGANVVHGVTVAHLTRREGLTRVHFRNNLAWVRDVGTISAVVDTLGISPWGRAARVALAQWVPVVRCAPARPLREVTLRAGSTAWLARPVGEKALSTRGNGRGELMNTASGWYLAELMADGAGTLPPISRLRAFGARALRRGPALRARSPGSTSGRSDPGVAQPHPPHPLGAGEDIGGEDRVDEREVEDHDGDDDADDHRAESPQG